MLFFLYSLYREMNPFLVFVSAFDCQLLTLLYNNTIVLTMNS